MMRLLALVALALMLAAATAVVVTSVASAQTAPPACDDGIDNDGDGRVDADEDRGCADDYDDPDETDPAPVPSTVSVTRARPYGCAVETGVEVLPDLEPARLFPFSTVDVTLAGRSGPAKGLRRTRELPLSGHPGYLFRKLRPGRYDVIAFYPGDPFRFASAEASRGVELARKRCEVYVAGTGIREVRPDIIYIGASQRIYGLRWRSWGGRRARATGIFPVNNCVPDCARGSISPRRVAVTLSRKRLCRGYDEYLRLRYRPLKGSLPDAASTDFSYRC
jgi:hypothetical protein